MFGGYGVDRDDCMFALITRGKPMTLQYFEAPPDVFEEQGAMRLWVYKAYETALRASQGQRKNRGARTPDSAAFPRDQ